MPCFIDSGSIRVTHGTISSWVKFASFGNAVKVAACCPKNGEKIASNEELEATLDSPSHLEEYTAYYGTLNESRDGVSFKNVPKGKYMLTLKRILKLETKDNDAPAKGEIRLVFYDKKEVTVK